MSNTKITRRRHCHQTLTQPQNKWRCNGSILSFSLQVNRIDGHGFIYDPPSRSTLNLMDPSIPLKDVDWTGVNCGGFSAQHNSDNQGRCGECGDKWSTPRPRPHELGHPSGYATGIIGQNYTEGQVVHVVVSITANHKGHFEFRLCQPDASASSGLEDETTWLTQDCFDRNPLRLIDGSTRYQLPSDKEGYYGDILLRLPARVVCHHCVIQWTYTAGNNWGPCNDGSEGLGCGPQETFRNCADVAIYPAKED